MEKILLQYLRRHVRQQGEMRGWGAGLPVRRKERRGGAFANAPPKRGSLSAAAAIFALPACS